MRALQRERETIAYEAISNRTVVTFRSLWTLNSLAQMHHNSYHMDLPWGAAMSNCALIAEKS